MTLISTVKIDVNVSTPTLPGNKHRRDEMTSGLEDVVAAETVLSDVDGKNGQLIVRGVSLDKLVVESRFEDVVGLLFEGFFPAVGDIGRALGEARSAVFAEMQADPAVVAMPPVEGMRALLARFHDGGDLATALRLVAAPAVFCTALLRLGKGLA